MYLKSLETLHMSRDRANFSVVPTDPSDLLQSNGPFLQQHVHFQWVKGPLLPLAELVFFHNLEIGKLQHIYYMKTLKHHH